MAEATDKPKAKKVRRVTGVYAMLKPPDVVVHPHHRHGSHFRPSAPEYRAEVTRSCKEWEATIEKWKRDHGSRDEESLTFHETISDVCSACDSPWEPILKNGVRMCCAACEAVIEKD